MMVYLSNLLLGSCKGRLHPRPKQLEDMTANEQAEYYKSFAEDSCNICSGSGGVLENEYEDRGYYQVPYEYFEPCECIDQD